MTPPIITPLLSETVLVPTVPCNCDDNTTTLLMLTLLIWGTIGWLIPSIHRWRKFEKERKGGP